MPLRVFASLRSTLHFGSSNLRKHGFFLSLSLIHICIPAPKPGFKKYADGRLRPDGKPGFNTLSGKLDFFSDRAAKFGYPGLPEYKPMTELSKEFDLRLMNGSRKPYITHSKTRTDQPYLMEIEDCLHVNINPRDAEARGICLLYTSSLSASKGIQHNVHGIGR